MELKSLYTVKKVIETGSFNKAASALNYAQSTITFQIRQLESELGLRLFEKRGNRMVLTDDGRKVLPLIEQVIASTDDLLSYSGNQDEIHGSLRIALPEALVTYKIMPVLKAYSEEAPAVHLQLKVKNCYTIYERLTSGDYDIGVHFNVRNYPSGFEVKELAKYPLVVIASPSLDPEECDLITPNQHKKVKNIINDPNALYMKILNNYLRQRNIQLDSGLELWSIEGVKQAVMNNLGISFLPAFTVEEELRTGKLKALPLETETSMVAVLVYNKQRTERPCVRKFIEVVDRTFPKE